MTQGLVAMTHSYTCAFAYKFTGKERDAESGLDNFGLRYNASTMGRFMTPDPSRLSVFFSNPQTWNRFSYVYNNPLRLTDDNGKWRRMHATLFIRKECCPG
jgi:RHS repeat-associated protein